MMNIQELVTYWQVIKKRLWLIGLLIAVTLGFMVTLSYLAEPVYEATTSFQVTAPLPAEVTIFSEFRTSSSRDELRYTMYNFMTVLQSKFVMGRVIDQLGLDTDVDQLLEEQIIIEDDETSDFVQLRVKAQDPQMAAAIANTLMDEASHYFGELSAGSITTNKEFIQLQMQEIKKELDESKAALIQFQIENKISSANQLLDAQQYLLRQLSLNRDAALADGDDALANSYGEIIATRERELQELILLSAEYEALRAPVQRIEETYSNLLDKETEAKLKENEIMSAKFILVIPAREPKHSLPRFSLKLLMVGGVISLVAGVVLAFVLEALSSLSELANNEKVFSKEIMVMSPQPE